MNAFGEFAISFCTVSILLGGLLFLCPSGKMRQPIRYAFGVVLLVCLLSLVPVFKNIRFAASDFSLEDTVDTGNHAEALLVLTLKTALKQNGISWKDFAVFTDKTEDGRIKIYKVVIQTDSSAEQIKSVLGALAEQCEIEVKNE